MSRFIKLSVSAGLVAIAALAALVAWHSAGGADPTDIRQVARGADIYARECASCHGARLEGEPEWKVRRPTGELPEPPHDATGHTWHHSDEQLFQITKNGLAGLAPPGYVTKMPAFGDRLSDDDIWAVLAFIKAQWPDEVRQRQPRPAS